MFSGGHAGTTAIGLAQTRLTQKGALMFYKPEIGHDLPHNPLNAIVSPRPIGWISTVSAAGVRNVAPYSLFNAVAYVPPQVRLERQQGQRAQHP